MSTRPFTHHSFWSSLFLFIYLLGLLVPANLVSAAGQAEPCPNTQAAGLPMIRVASADEAVEFPQETVDAAVFVANWREKLTDAKKVESLVYSLFLLHSDKIMGTDRAATLAKFREQYEILAESYANSDEFETHHDMVIFAMLDLALEMPDLALAAPYVWQELSVQDSATGSVGFDVQIGQSARRYELSKYVNVLDANVVTRLYLCAQDVPAIAQAFDSFYGDLVHAKVTDGAKELLDKNPDLALPAVIRDAIGQGGPVTVSLNDLKEMSEEEFGRLNATIDEIQGTLVEIDQQQKVIIDYLKDQELRQKHEELAKKKAAEAERKLNAVKSSFTIVTTLLGQIDPKLAKQVSVVSASGLQVGLALNKWLKAVSGLNGLDKISNASTIIMTGDVLGAVMGIVGLFGDQQPTPEQMILEEIGKLRQQVDQLRQEMHGRFDRIDAELNAIYTTMHDRFNQINIQLGEIDGNLREVQQSLLTLDTKLSRIERNNFEFLNTLGRRPLVDAINRGIGYEQRTGRPLPYEPNFVDLESLLTTWGTVHAFDPLNNGPTQRDFGDGKVLEELAAYPVDVNINYLNGWLMAHGVPPFANQRLASPRDWLLAGRAYTQLGLENPDHISEVDPAGQAALDQVGLELETAMKKISTIDTPAGPVGNSLLYSTVITYYEDKQTAMLHAIEAVETEFINGLIANRLQRSTPFDLFAGANQPLAYVTPELTTLTCANLEGHGSYPAPGNLKPLIPHFALYNLAEYLKLGTLGVCVSDQWINPLEYCDYDPERPNDPPDCYFLAQHKAVLEVQFDTVPIMSLTIDEGEQYVPTSRPEAWARDNWTTIYNYKAQFEAFTAADVPSPERAAQQAALLSATTAKLEEQLASYQKELYQKILDELTAGSLRPRAVELGGAKALLDSFVTLGLPRALEEDEFLRAMLFGGQQLVGDGQIQHSYALSLTQPITGVNLLVNPRLVLGQMARARADAFTGMVFEYLNAITAGTHVESPDYIANARTVLDLTVRIAEIQASFPAPETPTPETPTPETPTPETPVPETPTPETPVPETPVPETPQPHAANRTYLPLVHQ